MAFSYNTEDIVVILSYKYFIYRVQTVPDMIIYLCSFFTCFVIETFSSFVRFTTQPAETWMFSLSFILV